MTLGSAFFSPCTSAWVALHDVGHLPYFPRVAEGICAQFPGDRGNSAQGRGVGRRRDPKQREHLALQVGERGVEDLHGALALHQPVSLG